MGVIIYKPITTIVYIKITKNVLGKLGCYTAKLGLAINVKLQFYTQAFATRISPTYLLSRFVGFAAKLCVGNISVRHTHSNNFKNGKVNKTKNKSYNNYDYYYFRKGLLLTDFIFRNDCNKLFRASVTHTEIEMNWVDHPDG